MSEDWNSLVKDLVVGVCVIFIIASGPEGSAGLDGTPIAME